MDRSKNQREAAVDQRILHLLQEERDLDKGFKLLMEQYSERLYWHIRSLVKTHENADDVLQNTLIKVLKSIAGFKGRAKLYTWLYRIATNEALTFLKKEQRCHTEELEGGNIDHLYGLRAELSLDGDRAWNLLQQAISTLPDKQKAVFVLRYFEELSYREISDILGTSEGGLKASFHHAIKKVEKYLREAGAFI